MVIGNGIDIIEINRIATAMKRERFLTKNFSVAENAYFAKKQYTPSVVAVNFAAKEAFSKALGTGICGFSLWEVEVLRDERGKPYLRLNGHAKKAAENAKVTHWHVSLSHSRDYAIANVIAEQAECPKGCEEA
ncbi:MAG: holo-[acyl-carrier-protein] synthase [Ruminococcaceae bacterium]|nr:holo-[acyl-carrier-protein] synthase [Oscillospiraceae bacterium]